jgi:hypothetical protein
MCTGMLHHASNKAAYPELVACVFLKLGKFLIDLLSLPCCEEFLQIDDVDL